MHAASLLSKLKVGWVNWLILGLLVLSTFHMWFGPDIWHHLSRGQEMWRTGETNPAQHILVAQPAPGAPAWLFQILVYAVYSLGGVTLTTFFFSMIWLAIGVLRIRITEANRFSILGPLSFLAFVLCIQLRLEHRPENFSFLILSLIFLLLPTGGKISKWKLASLFFLEVLWTNSHGYFVLGVLAAGANLVAELIERSDDRMPRVKAAGLVFVVMLVATLFDPSGLGVWKMLVLYSALLKNLNDTIEDFFPTYRFAIMWPMQIFWIYWIAIASWSMWSVVRRRHVFAALVALGGCYLGMQSFRGIALFLIMSGPATATLCAWLEPIVDRVGRQVRSGARVALAATTCFLIVTTLTGSYYLWKGSGTALGIGLDWAQYPIGAVDYLKSISFNGRLYCDTSDGGYVEFMMPDVRILGDSYFSDGQISRVLITKLNDPAGLQELDRQYGFSAAIVSVANGPLLNSIFTSDMWTPTYSDSHRIVFMKRSFNNLADLVSGSHYHGEDLRRWGYRDNPALWAQIAGALGNRPLMVKLIDEMSAAQYVPSSFIKTALQISIGKKDRDIGERAIRLRNKMFLLSPDDEREISNLIAQID